MKTHEKGRPAPVGSGHLVRRKRDLWNKCQECGRLISYDDIQSGKATHTMLTPDSDVSYESWETLCRDHSKPNTEVSNSDPNKTS